MPRSRGLRWASLLLCAVGIVFIGLALSSVQHSTLSRPVSSTRTPEPLVPTRTPVRVLSAPEMMVTREMAATVTPMSSFSLSPTPVSQSTPRDGAGNAAWWQGRARWGVGVPNGHITRYDIDALQLGWYLDWTVNRAPPRPGKIEYVQMIRVKKGVLDPDAKGIAEVARANAGSLWLIGNEPDVKWQDNVDAATYADLYHQAYTAIKSADPSAQVAIGGISQPTPLRLRYLDTVLSVYQQRFGARMPMDVWNVHNFILREERGAWGVDIPPGMADDRGVLYEVDDSGNIQAFRQQIVDFRRWMAQRGYGGQPLIVSEYGIPMPEDYGFPPERVAAFVADTFDFFLTATDPATGDPTDGYRLVQRWCWYSLGDTEYRTGNLFVPETRQMTELGRRWVEYVTKQ